MAYIAPDSDIEFCRGFPLDRGHEYAIYFASASAQYSAIHAYAAKIYDKNSYQRVNKRTIRVGELADNLQGVNYMAFRNTAFGTKWFYAFVDEVNYINNSVCEVVYTIDPLQTYLFDFNWNACTVIREHTATDNILEWLEPEQIAEPTQKYSQITSVTLAPTFYVASTKDLAFDPTPISDASEWPNVGFQEIDGIMQGAKIYEVAQVGTITTKAAQLDKFGLAGAIVAVWTGPTAIGDDKKRKEIEFSFSNLTFDGYLPKNKKLYSSPFCHFVLMGFGNNVQKFDVQGFTNGVNGVQIVIRLNGTETPNGQYFAYPETYKGYSANDGNKSLGFREFSVSAGSCVGGTWVSDYYANWAAQQKTSDILRMVSGGISVFASSAITAASGGSMAPIAISGVANLFNTGGQIRTEHQLAANTPNNLMGGSISADLHAKDGCYGYTFSLAYPTRAQAENIDAYFTRYGYACNKIKVPSTNNRPYWTYVKTNGCAFTPKIGTGIPAPDMEAINSYFDKGITWFKTAADVGRFDRDNSPV